MGTNVVTVQKPNRKFLWYSLIATVVLSVIATVFVVKQVPKLLRLAPAVDDPILMAGGSLTIRGGPGGHFNVSASGHDAVYTPANGTINRVDLYYRDPDGTPAYTSLPFSAGNTVQFNYCSDAAHCTALTVHGNPSGHGFEFGPIDGDSIPAGTNLFTQVPATGYIHSVVFGGATFLCRDAAGADGKCSVVVNYCRWCS